MNTRSDKSALGQARSEWSYVAWRFMYYRAHGRVTYRDIDDMVKRGKLKPGDMPHGKEPNQ